MLSCQDPSFFPAQGLVSFRIIFSSKKKKLENMIKKAQSEQGREYPQGSQEHPTARLGVGCPLLNRQHEKGPV